MKIGTVIRLERQARGFTRAGLAEKSGLTAAALWLIEKHKTEPRLTSLRLIASALETTVQDLLSKMNSTKPSPHLG